MIWIGIILLALILAVIVVVFALPRILRNADIEAEDRDREAATLSDKQIDLIFKGIRPDGMSKEDFNAYRKEKEQHIRQRAKGQVVFKSNQPMMKKDSEGNLKSFKHSTYESSVKIIGDPISADEITAMKKTFNLRTAIWTKAFEFYNKNNFRKLSMGCAPCWSKVILFCIKHAKNETN